MKFWEQQCLETAAPHLCLASEFGTTAILAARAVAVEAAA